MEIRRWHCYVVINCALILPFLSAKTFSINEALAAESKLKKTLQPAPSPVSSETNTRFSLNRALSTDPLKKLRKYKRGSLSAIESPLIKTKNIFQIGSSRLKALLSPLRKHKTPSKKREIHKNDKIDEKYFPLFKNLGLLFDNLLDSESRDSYEISKHKQKRYKFKGDERGGVVCSCALKSDSDRGETKSHKKAIISTKDFTTKKPAFTSAAASGASVADLSGLGQDQDVSSLLPRDTPGSRGDDHGYSERSSPTFHRNSQRNFARNIRNRKHHSRNGEHKANAKNDEEDTDSDPRDDASSAEPTGRYRGTSDIPSDRGASTEDQYQKSKKTNVFRGQPFELPRKVQLKTGRDETKSEEFVPKYIRGIRGSVSENKIGDFAESLQSEENYKEDIDSIPFPSADDKRIAGGSSKPPKENQEVGPRNENIISINDLTDINLALQNNPRDETPSVTIIDGYSVARDKNGQNKLSEKAIRIHG